MRLLKSIAHIFIYIIFIFPYSWYNSTVLRYDEFGNEFSGVYFSFFIFLSIFFIFGVIMGYYCVLFFKYKKYRKRRYIYIRIFFAVFIILLNIIYLYISYIKFPLYEKFKLDSRMILDSVLFCNFAIGWVLSVTLIRCRHLLYDLKIYQLFNK